MWLYLLLTLLVLNLNTLSCTTAPSPPNPFLDYFPETSLVKEQSSVQKTNVVAQRIDPNLVLREPLLRMHMGRWILGSYIFRYIIDLDIPDQIKIRGRFRYDGSNWIPEPFSLTVNISTATQNAKATNSKSAAPLQRIFKTIPEFSEDQAFLRLIANAPPAVGGFSFRVGVNSSNGLLALESREAAEISITRGSGRPLFVFESNLSEDSSNKKSVETKILADPILRFSKKYSPSFVLTIGYDLSLCEQVALLEKAENCIANQNDCSFSSKLNLKSSQVIHFNANEVEDITLKTTMRDLEKMTENLEGKNSVCIPRFDEKNPQRLLEFFKNNTLVFSTPIPKGKVTFLNLPLEQYKKAKTEPQRSVLKKAKSTPSHTWFDMDHGFSLRVYSTKRLPHFKNRLADYIERRQGLRADLFMRFVASYLPGASVHLACPKMQASPEEHAKLMARLGIDTVDFSGCAEMNRLEELRYFYALTQSTKATLRLFGASTLELPKSSRMTPSILNLSFHPQRTPLPVLKFAPESSQLHVDWENLSDSPTNLKSYVESFSGERSPILLIDDKNTQIFTLKKLERPWRIVVTDSSPDQKPIATTTFFGVVNEYHSRKHKNSYNRGTNRAAYRRTSKNN